MKTALLCLALVLSLSTLRAADHKPLVIHEWGTCTSLQDEQGDAINGINADDEPVPNFVHRISQDLLQPPHASEETEGAVRTHPDVTMRLETPVLYFYPPAGWKARPVDVHVAFQGGWLTEFYPNALFNAPGFHPAQPGQTAPGTFGHIDSRQQGDLTWKGLKLGGNQPGPQTTEKVWLAPRAVASTNVTGADGETEKFLFYRGVAKADAALRVVRDTKGNKLELLQNQGNAANANDRPMPPMLIHAAWLVDIRADGACAFKALGELNYGKDLPPVVPASFAATDYSAPNMAALRDSMHTALVKEGLYADEATAMLNTWEASYFKNPGLRLFYLCPRADIDARIPLQVSVPADITRVLMGRIEIVTPAQRAVLKKIAAGGPAAKLDSLYASLGRFRNALVLNELNHHSTLALARFVYSRSLQAYVVPAGQ